MPISIKLEIFEGPFDLLFHLIEKAKIDIYDIPIAEVTEQYLEYLNLAKSLDMDLASEFVVMAATLLVIKSKMLLPKPISNTDEPIDPRDELVVKLLEYKRFKKLSNMLKEKYFIGARSFFKNSELADDIIDSFELADQISVKLLMKKYKEILLNKKNSSEIEYKKIFKDNITIDEKVKEIINYLSYKKWIRFDELMILYDSKFEVIISFLALLELVKNKKIRVKQNSSFDTIYLRKVNTC